MLIKRVKLTLFIFIIILLYSNPASTYGKNHRYILLKKAGTVYLYRNSRLRVLKKSPVILYDGDIMVTKSDSSAVFRIDKKFLKIFSYSKLVIRKVPMLIYGKLQISKNERFREPHYKVYPLPEEGKTTRILMWAVNRNCTITGKIIADSPAKKTLENLSFYRTGTNYRKALFGIPLGITDGKYKIKIDIQEKYLYSLIKFPFYVRKISYKAGTVKLEPKKLAILSPSEEKLKEQQILTSILTNSATKQYWKGRFTYPVKNPEIISDFGKKRKYYIGGRYMYSRFHYGIDLFGKRGTEIYAPNSGVVVFTGPRITTGNTIVIDHGLGVFSLFFHLDKIDVCQNVFVGKGCLIGKIGCTGLAESPHLHWGVLVNMVYVDPVQWIKYQF